MQGPVACTPDPPERVAHHGEAAEGVYTCGVQIIPTRLRHPELTTQKPQAVAIRRAMWVARSG